MFVRDHPLAVNLAEANGRAPPHIELSSVFTGCANMAETVREGYVIARADTEIANLITNRTLERREPILGAFSRRIRSNMLQRVYDIKR